MNPIILDFLINSEKIKEIDVTKSEFSALLNLFEPLTSELSFQILKLINDDIKYKNRHRENLDTLER